MYSEDTVGHLIPYAVGRRLVGTINSEGHSTANRLQSRTLRPPEVPNIGIPLTCPRKTQEQSVYFCTFRNRHLLTSVLDVKL